VGQARGRRTFFSKSLISSLAGHLDAAELAAWRSRTLEAACYPYLLVDARYEKVRVGGLQRLAS
jgi:transposase-like protein